MELCFLGIRGLKSIGPFIPRMSKSIQDTFGYPIAFEPFKISFELLWEVSTRKTSTWMTSQTMHQKKRVFQHVFFSMPQTEWQNGVKIKYNAPVYRDKKKSEQCFVMKIFTCASDHSITSAHCIPFPLCIIILLHFAEVCSQLGCTLPHKSLIHTKSVHSLNYIWSYITAAKVELLHVGQFQVFKQKEIVLLDTIS